MDKPPYDQRMARVLVRPLAKTGITPNQITAFSLLLALAGAWLLAQGEAAQANWGAGLFVLARFLDHFDGELARLTGKGSRFGYYFDYATGGLSYAALFAGMGIGLADGPLGVWALLLGALGAASALISLFLNLDLDRQLDLSGGEAVGYPSLAGFELEDGIYLIAPITWLGWLTPFFTAAGIGAGLYCLWTLGRVVKARLAKRPRL
ncbi:MAG: CDP-alcohol phosphatidyltransferase family protein [Kiloniellales bacterium]